MDDEIASRLSLERYTEVLVNSDDEAWRHVPAAGVHVEEPDGSTVFLWREEDDWITWALCEPYVYENPLYLSMSVLAYGTGVVASLRECRHMYLGENGYLFYAPFAKLEWLFKRLREWFDGD